MAKKISLEELAQENGVEMKVRDEKVDYSTYNPSKRDKASKQNNIFTYPYNFVSLGEVVEREERKLGKNSGKLNCVLVNYSPLFIGGEKSQSKKHTTELFLEDNLNYIIPASSIKGEIRNIIEAITHSCIRSKSDKIPNEFKECTNIKKLCFACRLFGVTGNSEEKKEDNMVAHMGRVFITDAKTSADKEKLSEVITLKPLGEPHPSLARFYLKKGTYDEDGAKIRGRKFYWHHSDKIKANGNYKSYLKSITTSAKEAYNSSLSFIKPNNTFEFEVEFKNLTDEELGVLIYSLELEEGLLHKFGKAKAFGFGSSKIEIQELLLKSKNRYTSFETSYEKEDTKKYKEIAQKEYVIESKEEIRELKTILSEKNSLNFEESPFPEAVKNGKKNTLNWFTENRNAILPNILDYKKNR